MSTSIKRPSRHVRGARPAAVYDGLRHRILGLDLAPGASIDEREVVETYGVSRTPVREAFVRLAGEGLIDLLPNRGARVSSLDLVRLQEHLEAFELMQRTATVLAAERRPDHDLAGLQQLAREFEAARTVGTPDGLIDANWRFHHAIGEACGNRVIAQMYDSTLTEGLRVARLAMSSDQYGSKTDYQEHLDRIVDEHALMVQAIAEHDLSAAATLADSHTRLARRRVAASLDRGLPAEVETQLMGLTEQRRP